MDEKGRQSGSHEMRGSKWVKSKEGERRQDAEINVRLAFVVGMGLLLPCDSRLVCHHRLYVSRYLVEVPASRWAAPARPDRSRKTP